MSDSSVLQSTAVIVLNFNGRDHLRPCLEAVLAMRGLPGPAAVIVADNGSTDGSLDMARSAFPGVGSVDLTTNLGFAAGNNAAAEAVDTDYVLFLNNDTAVASDVLATLAAEIDRGAACAGARLVDWSGRNLDFDGGGATFSGHGHPFGHGRQVPSVVPPAGATLFCSGAAMLVDRRAYLDLGGFDPDYFAYYEDVDLGWRLWMAGLRAIHVPAAIVRHRGGGSAGGLPTGRRAALHERNALANVVKWYDSGRLRYLLPAALSLAAVRAGAPLSVIDSAAPALRFGLPLPAEGWEGWRALSALSMDWRGLSRARSVSQSRRRAADVEVLPLLIDPMAPVPPTRAMRDAARHACERFNVPAVLGYGDAGLRVERGGVGARYGPSEGRGPRRVIRAWRTGGVRAVAERGESGRKGDDAQ